MTIQELIREVETTMDADIREFLVDVETWMHSQAYASPIVTWSNRGRGALTVHDPEHLADRVGGLRQVGSWAVIRRGNARLWAQCMRVDEGWIVEVNGVPGPDCFARRIASSERASWSSRLFGQRRAKDAGRLMAVYRPEDVIGTDTEVAEIVWTWLRGRVREGYELRDL